MAASTLRLRVRLLGWPQVFLVEGDEERPLDLPGNKPQAILYYLLMAPGPVSRDTLMWLFWPESDMHRARTSLRNALYQLQKSLPPEALEVNRQSVALSSRYRWEVDVRQVQDLLQDSPTLDRLRQAVALYRGDFLEGFHVADAPEFAHWQTSMAQQLRVQMLEALDRGLRDGLARGRWRDVEALLRFAVALEPWREDFYYTLIQVLMWQGKYTAALKVYQQCCARLQEEWQADPGPELEALVAHIHHRRRHPPAFRVPELPLPLIDREEDLEALCALLQEYRLVTLVGPNGVGKTMLALAFAHHHRHRFADGVYFVSLEDVRDADAVPSVVAMGLGLTPEGDASLQQILTAHLSSREMLLILDNMEHARGAAPLLAAWLRASPGLRVVATSQEPLGLRHERVYTVRPLSYPSEYQVPPPETYGAGRLLLALWKRFVPAPEPGPEDAGAIAQLCRLLEGLPLALELAAMQLRHRPLARLVADLERDLDVLQAAWPQAPARHRSLRTLFEHLWASLTADEQAALLQLSVFAGPFTLEEAQEVTGLSSVEVHRLVTRGLVQPVLDWPQGFHLHRVLRTYIREKWPEAEHPRAARHARVFLTWLARFPEELSPADLQRLYPRRRNLEAAWLWAARHRAWSLLEQALDPWQAFFEVQGLYAEGARVFAEALRLLAQEDHPLLGHLYARGAALSFRHGHLREALHLAQEALARLPEEDLDGRLFTQNVLGVIYLHLGEFAQAMAVLEEVVRRSQAAGRTYEHIKGLINLSSAYLRTGRYREVRPLLEQGVALCQQVGDRPGEGFFHLHLGNLALLEQRWDEVEPHLRAALAVAQETGWRHFEMHAWVGLAAAWALQNGPSKDIAEAARRAVDLAREMGDGVTEARALGWLAWAQHREGDHATAWRTLTQALDDLEEEAKPTRMHLMAIAAYMWALQGAVDRAAALAHYVAHHPATEAPTRERVQMLLATLPVSPSPSTDEPPPVWP